MYISIPSFLLDLVYKKRSTTDAVPTPTVSLPAPAVILLPAVLKKNFSESGGD